MAKLRTQRDLAIYAERNNACNEARRYIDQFPAATAAKKIWLNCHHAEWMIWLGSRWNPAIALAYCNKTFKRISDAPDTGFVDVHVSRCEYVERSERDMERAAVYLREGDLNLFYANLHWAFYESHRAARDYFKEHNIRLNELRLMW